MQKLRLMTIVGTRPEIIRLSQVIKACDRYFDHTLVHTGQNWDYTLSGIFFEDLGLRQPDLYLDVVGEDLGETIGNVIAKSYKVLAERRPDALLILGDTNSCLCAIAAKRLHIPIFHMEAGNRCFDERLPEETNRRIVDHIADVNLCYSEHARRYLAREGTAVERTFVTGSPMAEVLSANWGKIRASGVLEELGVAPGGYIVLSAHREENIDDEESFLSLMDAVNGLAEAYRVPVIYSTHPRSAAVIARRGVVFHELVRQMKPFGFSDYNCLQMRSMCTVSDSGTLPEEASFFAAHGEGFAAVSIRTSTERPEALDKGNFMLAGIRREQVMQAVQTAIDMLRAGEPTSPVPDYTDETVSAKVVRLIQSYTGIIRKTVWHEG